MFGIFKRTKHEPVQHNLAVLVRIDRIGRENVFHFVRNGEVFTISTMGLLSDDVGEWRKIAGLK